MPISGVFKADFSDFTTAVDSAVIKLRDIETGSGKVESSLNRVANSFSGAKVIQDATLMAKVFTDAGGAASFTEKELARMGATGAEAAAKLTAMGQDVPPGIAKIAAEAKNADTAHSGLATTVRSLATDFLAMFTARAAFDFVKNTINEASALNDLSQQTHMSVEEIQLLAGAMSEFGVDQDTLAKGLYKLSRGIAGGDESVATGLHLMGMSLKDVDGLNGKELFLKIEGGLATLQGGLRDTAAADLFGGRLGMAMAGASEGIVDTMAKWERLNTVASKDSVEAMDMFGETIARTNKNLSSIAANMIGPVAQGFNTLYDATTKGASKWDLFGAMIADAFAKQTVGATGTENLTKLLTAQQPAIDLTAVKTAALAAQHGAVAAAIDTRTQAEKFMAALEKDAAVSLSAAQVANLEHLKEIGALNAKNAEGVGVNAVQFAKYTAGVEAAAKATAELKKVTDEAAKVESAYYTKAATVWETVYAARNDLYATDSQRLQNKALRDYDVAVKEAQDKGVVNVGYYNALWALYEVDGQKIAAKTLQNDKASREYYQKLMADAKEAYDFALDHAASFSGAHIRLLWDTYRAAENASFHWAQAADEDLGKIAVDAKKTAAAMDQLTAATNAAAVAEKKLRDAGSSFTYDLTTNAGVEQYRSMNTGMDIGWSNQQLIDFAKQGGTLQQLMQMGVIHMKAFAGGVSNAAGGWAMVGERGPEAMYVPTGASILPNGSGMGGSTTNVVNHIYVNGTAADVARQVAAEIMKTVKQGTRIGSA